MRLLNVNAVNFSIDQGHEQNLSLVYSQVIGLDVLGSTSIVVQKQQADGSWASVDGGSDGTFLNLNLLGNRAEASASLGEGVYRAFVAVKDVAGISLLGKLSVDGVDLNYREISAINAPPVNGNVMENDGSAAFPGQLVTRVSANGGAAQDVQSGPAGTEIAGQYGTLVIHQDGSYVYRPNASTAGVGKVDAFTYTLHNAAANTDSTADLYVRINSEGQGLVWNDNDWSQPAVRDFMASDDRGDAAVTWRHPVNDDFFVDRDPLAALLGVPRTVNSGVFTLTSDMAASGTVVVSVTVAAAANGSVTIEKEMSPGNWQPVSSNGSFNMVVGLLGPVKTINIADLDLGPGNYRVHTSLTGLAGVVTIATDVNVAHTNQWEVASARAADGNLFKNDGDLPLTAKLQVDNHGGFVDVASAGVVIAGAYGSLTVYSNGGYHYQPLANLPQTAAGYTDVFQYRIVMPDGAESAAHLTVKINGGGDTPLAIASFEAPADGGEHVHGLDGRTAGMAAPAQEETAGARTARSAEPEATGTSANPAEPEPVHDGGDQASDASATQVAAAPDTVPVELGDGNHQADAANGCHDNMPDLTLAEAGGDIGLDGLRHIPEAPASETAAEQSPDGVAEAEGSVDVAEPLVYFAETPDGATDAEDGVDVEEPLVYLAETPDDDQIHHPVV
ncbi:hypothetical protein GCM10019059_03600 [Camelimonas fluminis]|nr:hypothetical protein GCM10019059_03600 [Camelimonas fluminis]